MRTNTPGSTHSDQAEDTLIRTARKKRGVSRDRAGHLDRVSRDHRHRISRLESYFISLWRISTGMKPSRLVRVGLYSRLGLFGMRPRLSLSALVSSRRITRDDPRASA